MPHPIFEERLNIKIKSPNKLLFGRKFSFLASPISQIIILTLKLEKEYRLHEPQAPSKKVLEGTWLERYPQAWAETGAYGRDKKSAAPHHCEAENWWDSYWCMTIPHEQRGPRGHLTSHSKDLRTRCFGPLSVSLEYSVATS